jgi:hypothetical protein
MKCDGVTNKKAPRLLYSTLHVQYVSRVSPCGEAPAICNDLLQLEQTVEHHCPFVHTITNHASSTVISAIVPIVCL